MHRPSRTSFELVQRLIDEMRDTGGGLHGDAIRFTPFCFSGDGLTTIGRNIGFLDDQKFMAAFTRAIDRFEVPSLVPVLEAIIWRKHVLCSLAKQALHLPGDFVECGVEWGFGVDVMTDYLDFHRCKKRWYLFDTFQGVPESQKDEGFMKSADITRGRQQKAVEDKFSHLPNIRIIQGMLPDALSGHCPETIAFLHIDLNNSRAEVDTFLALYPKVAIGGVIVFDDYGFLAFAKQHVTERSLFHRLGLAVTELPTGQAILIKTHEVKTEVVADEVSPFVFPEYVAQRGRSAATMTKSLAAESRREFLAAYRYFQSRVRYLSKSISDCKDPVAAERLSRDLAKYMTVEARFDGDLLYYTTFHEYRLHCIGEARQDLQRKIDLLEQTIPAASSGPVSLIRRLLQFVRGGGKSA